MKFTTRMAFQAFGVRWSRTRERGASAVVIALCLLLVMAAAALSFDTANLALKRQTLQNLTDAAAQAGAVYLRDNPKDITGAQQAAYTFAHNADATFQLADVTLWCIVPSTGATKSIAPGNIGPVCDPLTTTGVVCDQNICAIPCNKSGASCNAIKIKHQEDVQFYFAPAIGKSKGSTGAVQSISCAKSCGSGGTPNPLDIAIVADRTPSMSDTDFDAMKAGIKASLATMTPEYQFVTLGTINRSNTSPTDSDCLTSQGAPVALVSGKAPQYYPAGGARAGKWMPLGFSNTYLTGKLGDAVGTRTLIETKSKTNLGYQVQCMDHVSTANLTIPSTNVSKFPWGTSLAAPLKSAAQLLLRPSDSNLGTLTTARQALTTVPAKKWVIFETDGQPDETMGYNTPPSTDWSGNVTTPGYKDSNTAAGSTSVSKTANATDDKEPTALDPGNDVLGCQNLVDVATNAKAAGNDVNIIMIAYGAATTAKCGTVNGKTVYVKDQMAKAASPVNGTPSLADKSCTSTNGQTAPENADGDYFFCASTAADLASIFKTAIGMASSPNTKFVRMPS